MHALLRYTLDLFEPLALADTARKAPKVIAPINPVNSARPVPPGQPAQPLSQVVAPVAFAHPRANRELRLPEATVAYLFERGRRRTIGFVVGADGLVVRAPRWTPIYEVELALQEKAPWITRKLCEARERHARQEGVRIEWRDGATVPYLGGVIAVHLDPGHTFTAVGGQLDGAPSAGADAPEGEAVPRLRLGLPRSATPEQIRDAVQAWLMRQAKAHFTRRLDHFAPLLQVQWKRLSLSNASTRWGSARVDGAIRLNWRLIHCTPAVVDYVVAHELSHLRVMDHSAQFWQTVESVVPDYAHLRGQLKDGAVPKW
jgi:predicted metal-dependent hydrolase